MAEELGELDDSAESLVDAEINESGTCLTVKIYMRKGSNITEHAEQLIEFARLLQTGEIDAEQILDDTNH